MQVAIFNVYAQHPVDGGVRAQYNFTPSPRWSGAIDGALFQQMNVRSGTWWQLGIKGQFSFMERRYLYIMASTTRQEYNNISNSDTELRLIEGLNIETLSGFSHNLYLSQRRIIYRPTHDKAFCSDITYSQNISFRKISTKVTPFITASETMNITPDVSDASIIQRLRFGGGLSMAVTEHLTLLTDYHYAMGSRKQTFIGDANGVHCISLKFSIK